MPRVIAKHTASPCHPRPVMLQARNSMHTTAPYCTNVSLNTIAVIIDNCIPLCCMIRATKRQWPCTQRLSKQQMKLAPMRMQEPYNKVNYSFNLLLQRSKRCSELALANTVMAFCNLVCKRKTLSNLMYIENVLHASMYLPSGS